MYSFPHNNNSRPLISKANAWNIFLTAALLFILFQLSACSEVADAPAGYPIGTATFSEADSLTDAQIAGAIQREIKWTKGAMSVDMDINVVDGIVTLSGETPHLLARNRIESLATRVKGVRAVVNNLEVMPSNLTDVEIQENIRSALRENPATESWEVEPVVDDGYVTLIGGVDSYAEQRLAGYLARGVKGVRGLDNQVLVSMPAARLDADIEHDIEQAMLWNARLDDGLIEVNVQDGQVQLSGFVGSVYEKKLAESLARVNGVTDVNGDSLEISWISRNDMLRDPGAMNPDDAEIEKAVRRALQYDPRVNSFDVIVNVVDGTASLAGVVTSLKARRAAAQDAGNTLGVWRIENEIVVEPDARYDDEQLRAAVEAALQRDVLTDPDQIQIDVTNATAVLRGMVDTYFEKTHYEDVVSRVPRIEQIVNDLAVVNPDLYYLPPYLYDWDPMTPGVHETFPEADPLALSNAELKDNVEYELFWSPYVDESSVEVVANDGIVTLSGTVSSLAAQRAAVEEAYDGGAREVVDNLTLDYSPNESAGS